MFTVLFVLFAAGVGPGEVEDDDGGEHAGGHVDEVHGLPPLDDADEGVGDAEHVHHVQHLLVRPLELVPLACGPGGARRPSPAAWFQIVRVVRSYLHIRIQWCENFTVLTHCDIIGPDRHGHSVGAWGTKLAGGFKSGERTC